MAKKQEIGNRVLVKGKDDSIEKSVSGQQDKIIDAYTVPIVFHDTNDVIDPLVEDDKRRANKNYNMRWRCQQRLIWHFNQEIERTETAKFEQSLIVHIITPEELHNLILFLSCPISTEFNNVNVINWTLDSSSYKKSSTLDFSALNVAIVTIYENVKAEKSWHLWVLFLVPNQEMMTMFCSVFSWL